MSDAEIRILLDEIKGLRADMREDFRVVHTKIDHLNSNGCARFDAHRGAVKDHESRLRGMERYVNRQAGQVALLGGGAGLLTAFLVAVGKFLLQKVGGNG